MITLFIGPKGSGKDLGMTSRLKKRKAKGDTVLTNYQVSFADDMIDASMLIQIAKDEIQLQKCSIALTEIHLIIDPRRSSTKRNILISYIISQVRKRSVRLYGNTQTLAKVEKRLLEDADYVVFCRRVGKNFFYYKVYDVQNGWRIKARYILDGRKIYPLYSTEQIITDFDPGLLTGHKQPVQQPRKMVGKGFDRDKEFDLLDFPPETEEGLEPDDEKIIARVVAKGQWLDNGLAEACPICPSWNLHPSCPRCGEKPVLHSQLDHKEWACRHCPWASYTDKTYTQKG